MTDLIQKISDEGTSDPFIARLFFGILELRDYALTGKLGTSSIDEARDHFDSLYDPVLNAMRASRKAVRNIEQLLIGHRGKLSTGEIVRFQPSALEISESIDQALRDETTAFLVNGVIAMKRTQKVVEQFGINIGCVFAKDENFAKGIEELESGSHFALSRFLLDTRATWSEKFVERRNSLEHRGWSLPRVKYCVEKTRKVEIVEPEIDGLSLSLYSSRMLNCMIGFVENAVIHALKSTIKPPLVLEEIPRSLRDPVTPKRFRLAVKEAGIQEWEICFSPNDFP